MDHDHPGADAGPGCPDALPSAARGGPTSHALSRVARLHRITAGRLLRAAGLYPGQEFVMMYLWDSGPVRQSELIRVMELDPSTVTKMLQRLEQGGHVRRSPDPADRRAVLVEATETSCALLKDVSGAWSELEQRLLAGLRPAERAELSRLLGLVEDNLCREVSAGCPTALATDPAPPEGTTTC
ncbi:MarR family winged helix-turn-helix transcriptional regulator [Streptomyces lichenis]|uniref:MarR family winged helix-turn-helix transcriptional regulator n=1 Tax=Streptomyces lichenis TaxID=2306967 RepID=A0ABT0ICG5_9ACTN|nr:MarR family winged helix-turn-helix transcriptional regulator [Streptomyces lichenis]MCK8679008.1 MarR family winged helix-turn-helix transcriptional regulator [Streptomyces lichenis]